MNEPWAVKANLTDLAKRRDDTAIKQCCEDLRYVQCAGSRVFHSDNHSILVFTAQTNKQGTSVAPFLKVTKESIFPPFLTGMLVFRNGVFETYKEESDVTEVTNRWSASRMDLQMDMGTIVDLIETEGVDLTDFETSITKYVLLRPDESIQNRPLKELVDMVNVIIRITKGSLVRSTEIYREWITGQSAMVVRVPLDAPITVYAEGNLTTLRSGLFEAMAIAGVTDITARGSQFQGIFKDTTFGIDVQLSERGPIISVGVNADVSIPITPSFAKAVLPVTGSVTPDRLSRALKRVW